MADCERPAAAVAQTETNAWADLLIGVEAMAGTEMVVEYIEELPSVRRATFCAYAEYWQDCANGFLRAVVLGERNA